MWWSFFLKSENAEQLSPELFEHGAQGVEVLSPDTIRCYIESEQEGLGVFQQQAKELGFEILNFQEVIDKNWVQECEEVWEPLTIGKLTVVPQLTSNHTSNTGTNGLINISIIPGNGFGTGHHESTKNALLLLQHDQLKCCNIQNMLDAGAGSGILAIGGALIFQCKVDAYDNDPMACENAIENVALNHLSEKIQIHSSCLTSCLSQFDLVVANLYAELIQTLATHLTDRIKPGGHMIVSGIMEQKSPETLSALRSHKCEVLEQIISDGWYSALLVKSGSSAVKEGEKPIVHGVNI